MRASRARFVRGRILFACNLPIAFVLQTMARQRMCIIEYGQSNWRGRARKRASGK